MSFYIKEEVKAIKKNGLNNESYNYLRLILVEISKVYRIELFFMKLAALCSSTSIDYFIYKSGSW